MKKRQLMAALAAVFALAGCDALKTPTPEEQALSENARWERYRNNQRTHTPEVTAEALRAKGVEINEIIIPREFYDLPVGAYEATFQTGKGPKECTASVVRTTHGMKNVVLDCN